MWGLIVLIGVVLLVVIAIGGGVAEFLSKLGVPSSISLGIGVVVGLFVLGLLIIVLLFGQN